MARWRGEGSFMIGAMDSFLYICPLFVCERACIVLACAGLACVLAWISIVDVQERIIPHGALLGAVAIWCMLLSRHGRFRFGRLGVSGGCGRHRGGVCIGGRVVCDVMRGRCVRRPRNVRGRRCETAIRRGSFFRRVLGRGYSRACLRLVARGGVCSCMPRWFP